MSSHAQIRLCHNAHCKIHVHEPQTSDLDSSIRLSAIKKIYPHDQRGLRKVKVVCMQIPKSAVAGACYDLVNYEN